ncbi:MAG: Na/Pi cotransporter family protein [Clostridiales bacterium]|nr:Na/Pi cotransporter family protein [Clostridiales bacterium]
MTYENVLLFFGALALFLYGMKMMSSGLEAAAGNQLKGTLEKLTTNRFLGIAVGAGITALIQSSTTTTVMVVGFVNSGIMNLTQALWIIMGANIGTNITSQLVALDFEKVAPIFIFIGVILVVFVHKKKFYYAGEIIAGLGILLFSMNLMQDSLAPLQQEPAFIDLLTKFKIPVIGLLVGLVFTAILHSSAASIGILQALAMSGSLSLENSVFILYGINIGTCVTSLVSSLGSNRNAKRTAVMHLTFNVIGAVLFSMVTMFTPFVPWIVSMWPHSPAVQIANLHLIFNLSTTIVLLPFGKYIVKFSEKILPDRPEDLLTEQHLQYLEPSILKVEHHKVGAIAIFVTQLQRETERMLSMAKINIGRSFDAVKENSEKAQDTIWNTEEYIDYLNKEISYYISHVIALEMVEQDSVTINAFFKITGNIERLGDHATNIAGYANLMEEKGLHFSAAALAEVERMRQVSMEALDLIYQFKDIGTTGILLEKMKSSEQLIDDLTREFRRNQMERLAKGSCSGESCVIYSELLTDFERVGDHLLNIAEAIDQAKIVDFSPAEDMCPVLEGIA